MKVAYSFLSRSSFVPLHRIGLTKPLRTAKIGAPELFHPLYLSAHV